MPPACTDLSWVSDWVGIPYIEQGRDLKTGLDCLGLFVHLSKSRLGIDIPDPECKPVVALAKGLYSSYGTRYEKVTGEIIEGDLALSIYDRALTHIGYCIGHRGLMLHADPIRECVVMDNMNDLLWSGRIKGVYRYVG